MADLDALLGIKVRIIAETGMKEKESRGERAGVEIAE